MRGVQRAERLGYLTSSTSRDPNCSILLTGPVCDPLNFIASETRTMLFRSSARLFQPLIRTRRCGDAGTPLFQLMQGDGSPLHPTVQAARSRLPWVSAGANHLRFVCRGRWQHHGELHRFRSRACPSELSVERCHMGQRMCVSSASHSLQGAYGSTDAEKMRTLVIVFGYIGLILCILVLTLTVANRKTLKWPGSLVLLDNAPSHRPHRTSHIGAWCGTNDAGVCRHDVVLGVPTRSALQHRGALRQHMSRPGLLSCRGESPAHHLVCFSPI